jgi:uncharacterized protein YjbI with pentapeptide repeats
VSASKKELTDRWRSGAGGLLAEEIVARLVTGRSTDGLGLDEHEGRLDLRCLPLPTPRRLDRFETQGWFVEKLRDVVGFRRVQLARLDLSGAQLQSLRFHDVSIVDCRFDGAACRDWRLWATGVTGCTFSKADLRGAAVGTWDEGRRNEWRHVDFSGADFRVGVSQAALYEDCDFSGAQLAKVNFEQCTLLRCRFSGAVREVVFDGRELTGRPAPSLLEDVDFAEAMFEQVEFMGLDLSRVVVPKDPDIRLIRHYRCVVEHALAAVERDESLPARMLRGEFQNRLRMMRAIDEDNVFNRRDYFASGGEELSAFAQDVFGRAETECLMA